LVPDPDLRPVGFFELPVPDPPPELTLDAVLAELADATLG
jgi:hypothetical protein